MFGLGELEAALFQECPDEFITRRITLEVVGEERDASEESGRLRGELEELAVQFGAVQLLLALLEDFCACDGARAPACPVEGVPVG